MAALPPGARQLRSGRSLPAVTLPPLPSPLFAAVRGPVPVGEGGPGRSLCPVPSRPVGRPQLRGSETALGAAGEALWHKHEGVQGSEIKGPLLNLDGDWEKPIKIRPDSSAGAAAHQARLLLRGGTRPLAPLPAPGEAAASQPRPCSPRYRRCPRGTAAGPADSTGTCGPRRSALLPGPVGPARRADPAPATAELRGEP